MSTPQWASTLSLALEIPFDSTEETLWSNLFTKQTKFTEIFITTLTTIDIVRLPFIDYSFIKWFTHQAKNNEESIFLTIQSHFQAHLRKRVMQELLSLQVSDKEQFLTNLSKLNQKIDDLSQKKQELTSLKTIASFLQNLDLEIKELEEEENTEDQEL